MKNIEYPLLTIDIGKNLGWAVDMTGKLKNGKEVDLIVGHQVFKKNRIDFVSWFSEFLKKHRIKSVIYEEINFIANNAKKGNNANYRPIWSFGFFRTVIEDHCRNYKIPVQGILVARLRSAIIGVPNPQKGAVMMLLKSLGYKYETDDEGDAIACMMGAKIIHNKKSIMDKAIGSRDLMKNKYKKGATLSLKLK